VVEPILVVDPKTGPRDQNGAVFQKTATGALSTSSTARKRSPRHGPTLFKRRLTDGSYG
jgi:hypothetical protein